MKKRHALPALLLALTLLCGCANPSEFYEEVTEKRFSVIDTISDLTGFGGDPYAVYRKIREEKAIPFEEIEYVRPDVESMLTAEQELRELLEDGKTRPGRIEELLDDFFTNYSNFNTMYTVADIRNCIDLSDPYYEEEYSWCSEQCSVLSDAVDDLYYACGGSRYAKRLERNYFWDGFAEEYTDEEDSIYTDALVALMQEESDLISEYRAVVANPTVMMDGTERNIDEALTLRSEEIYAAADAYIALPTEESYELYLTAIQAYLDLVDDYYAKYNALEGDIFVRLVKVRQQMAAEAGYDSYEQMQYEFTFEREYTPEEAESFIVSVEENILPLRDEIVSAAEAYAENETPVVPDVSEQGLKNCLTAVVESMGGIFEDSYRYMTDYHMYDFSDSPNKTPMSFETYLNDYEAPFLLISPSNDSTDLLTAVHEFGHYTDSFGCCGATETLELAECFSQGLELLSLDMLTETAGEEQTELLGAYKVRDVFSVFQQQCAFAEFEHLLYELPEEEVTLENINALFLSTVDRFGISEEEDDTVRSLFWVDIPHFFEQPCYVISYPVSGIVALQFYRLEQERAGDGVKKYNDMLSRESGNLLDTLEENDLGSPFERNVVRQAATTLRLMAEKYL